MKIVKVNVDEEFPLAEWFQITSVPTLIVFSGKRVLEQMIGAPSPGALREKLARAASRPRASVATGQVDSAFEQPLFGAMEIGVQS